MQRIALLILVTGAALRCVAAVPLTAFTVCIGATGQAPVCRLRRRLHNQHFTGNWPLRYYPRRSHGKCI